MSATLRPANSPNSRPSAAYGRTTVQHRSIHCAKHISFVVVLSLGVLFVSGCGTLSRMPSETATSANTTATPVVPPDDREAPTKDNVMDLITAAERGEVHVVQRLLTQGAHVNAQDGRGRTALIAAAYSNHLDVAEVLITAGADVNIQDITQQSAYLIATSEVGDDPRLLNLTLQNGADVTSLDSYNGTGLIRAADRGYVEIVQALLATSITIDHVNRLGWTALLEAIILGDGDVRHTEVVRLLVHAGANVNLADKEGVTPLAHARERGYMDIVNILEQADVQ